ncbi:hypothetical protein D9619_005375 [Psilocybe cf. subviscida]|uniref:F-box domain-containing protein n=1 Tax=Psilocybe cf. subviscida TaxID=2480587 RepID=A0A8H5FBV3_9AGAR|nr:hypothetical protein D9619_005375 [Psilocybe cf. subviscida]
MSTTFTARFSTRLAEKQRAESSDLGTPASSTTHAAPRPKKQKLSASSNPESSTKATTNKRVRGRRGGLKMIHEMPLDIVLEIFGHLDPIDLLHVSRTSKGLRALTQGTGSQLIWKKAYENLGDSAPPIDLPGLNLMFLTSALYGKYCQVCTTRKGQLTLHASRIRLCWDCSVPNLVSFHDVEKDIQALCINTYLGRASVKLRYSTYFFKAELEFHRRKIANTKSRPGQETHQAIWSATMRQRRDYMTKLTKWSLSERYKTNQKYRDILARRQQDITSRIIAAGYEAEATYIRIARLPGVKIGADLTDKGWDRIKGRILSTFEYIRQQKLERDIKDCFSTRIYHFQQIVNAAFGDVPKPRIPVPFYEILHSEPFHGILTSYTGLGMRHLTDEMRQQLRIPALAERITEITNTWRKAADRHLLDLVNPGSPVKTENDDQPADTAPLELGTTLFTCHWCPAALSYPRVLVHSCFRDNRKSGNLSNKTSSTAAHDVDGDEEDAEEDDDDASNNEEEPEENYGIVKTTPLSVWNSLHIANGRRWNESGDEITFDSEASGAAKSILLAIGEDPVTMTTARIQAMDIRVECIRCLAANNSRRRRPRLFMTWNMAIIHDMQDHFEQPRSAQDWRLVVDKDELAQIKGHEDGKRRSRMNEYQCSFCHTTLGENKIKEHYTNCHSAHPFDETRQLEYVFEPYDNAMKFHPLPVHL